MNQRIDEIVIMVNGFTQRVPKGTTMAQLISLSNETDPHLIVELNGRFLYPNQYEETGISDGDTVEFINPDFGG